MPPVSANPQPQGGHIAANVSLIPEAPLVELRRLLII